MAELKHVVFDMGNVLMTFNGPAFARHYTDSDEDAHLLDEALFGSTAWALLDAGVIGHDTMRHIAEAHLPGHLHPNLHECFARWPECSEPLEDVCDLAIRLKQRGLGIYLLSNASTSIDLQMSRCPANDLLDGRVVSGFERIMKPDPTIYQLLCRRYDLDPASCLFVDDNRDNCLGAERAGMRSYHFTGDAAKLERAIDLMLESEE